VAILNGLCGATQPAKIAKKTLTSGSAAATMAVGDERNECQTSPPKNRAHAPGGGRTGVAPDAAARAPTLGFAAVAELSSTSA
jgi:hypothetical protein